MRWLRSDSGVSGGRGPGWGSFADTSVFRMETRKAQGGEKGDLEESGNPSEKRPRGQVRAGPVLPGAVVWIEQGHQTPAFGDLPACRLRQSQNQKRVETAGLGKEAVNRDNR